MKRMTYKALMKKVDDGDAEITAYDGRSAVYGTNQVVQVTLFKRGTSKRETVEVTGWPVEVNQ